MFLELSLASRQKKMQRSWPANYVVQTPILRKLALANEDAWLTAGALMLRCHNPAHVTTAATAESMNDAERALVSYQNALVHSPYSVPALSAVGAIYRQRENFPKVNIAILLGISNNLGY